jgi:histidine decarboxylase
MILPFVSDIKFDFRTKINSIAISGHKFIGSPIPCGIVLVRRSYMKALQTFIEYIDAHDTTISGSRDAFTPLILWYRIKTLGMRGFKKHVQYSMELAAYLVKELKKIGWPNVRRSFVTVSFKRPSQKLVNKWELAANQDSAHVICMPHETREELHRFVREMEKDA